MPKRLFPFPRPLVLVLALACCPASFAGASAGGPEDSAPSSPSNLRAAPLSSARLRLTWQDNSDDETHFVLLLREPRSGVFVEIPFAIPPDVTSVFVSQLAPATRYVFRVRARNAFGTSETSNAASATTFADDSACTVSDTELCLLGGRFRVGLRFVDPRPGGGEQLATVVPSTDQTGLFWFFTPGNVELIVKMLDGRDVNGHFWVFYGGVSDLEYRLEIVDTASGRSVAYDNRPGEICGRADIRAFAGEPGSGKARPRTPRIDVAELVVEPALPSIPRAAGPRASSGWADDSEQGACVPDGRGLCLLDRRLRVEVRWKNPHDGGSEGEGHAVYGGERSGYFWFFDPSNTELVVKALDGGWLNGHLWLFYGALTDLEYWLSVTDTVTGERRIYYNPPGKICGQADIEAFPGAPRDPTPD